MIDLRLFIGDDAFQSQLEKHDALCQTSKVLAILARRVEIQSFSMYIFFSGHITKKF
jgi:hypothetical protein